MAEAEKEFVVGTVRPTNRPEAGQELDLDTLIPAKIKFLYSTMNFTRGTADEFSTSMPGYEAKAAEFAKMGADLVRPSGAPPFMLLGYQKEQELIGSWEKKYGVQQLTSGRRFATQPRRLRRADVHLGPESRARAPYPRHQKIRRRHLFSGKDEQHFRALFRRCWIPSFGHGGNRCAFCRCPKRTARRNPGLYEADRRQAHKH